MRTAVLALLVLATPRVVLACPVCFGQSDSPMASAANLAIVFMLVIVGGVLAAFASFFVYLMRRARAVGAEPALPAGGRHVRPEGTAEC